MTWQTETATWRNLMSGSALPKTIASMPLVGQPAPITAPNPTASPTAPASTSTASTPNPIVSGDALKSLENLLSSYGLQSLVPTLVQYAQEGLDSTAINTLIQQTPEWKQRFAGNEVLRQRGFAELTPAQYLATESAYDQVFRANGLGYLANRNQFANLIGNNISASELNNRVQVATQYTTSQDPALLQALKQFHGLDTNHIVGYVLDPQRSLPYLQQLSNSTAIGAEAIRHGLGGDAGLGSRLERYASEGITQNQAASGFSQIAGFLPREQQLASIYGQSPYTQATAEADVLEGMASAQRARLRLNDLEAANFSGSSGGTARSFTQSSQGLF